MFKQLILSVRRVFVLFLGFVLIMVASTAVSANAPDANGDDFVPGEVVVKLVQAGDLAGVAADYNLDPVPLSQFGARPIYRLQILDGAAPPERAAALAADGRVMFAEPNFLGQTPEGRQRTPWAIGGDAGDYAAQWAPDVIRLPEAHTVTRGAGVVIAILDTGVDTSHPALAGRLTAGYDFVDMDDDPQEVGSAEVDIVFGHGTHVAGIIALTAPEATLMPVRVLDRDGVGNVWVLAEALAFAVDPDGDPATDDGADVINLSLSTLRQTQLLDELVAEITCANKLYDDDDDDDDDRKREGDNGCPGRGGRGTVVVAAAGNSGVSVREYPAAEEAPGLLAVAASTFDDMLASFSTFGPWVQVAAPGEDILSSVPGSIYGTWSGTSMAAPFAAGQAALVLADDPDLTAVEVVARIVETAVPISGPVPRRIDAAAALGVGAPAEEGVCAHFMGAVLVDNLFVPANASCTLSGTRVQGSITVDKGGTLTAWRVVVDGNIQAEEAAVIRLLAGTAVDGNVQIKKGGAVDVDGAYVDGDVQLESQTGTLSITGSQIDGNVQLFKNRGDILIAGNIIYGNLQCKENRRRPTGGNNVVYGKAEDQCALLGK